jgi:glycosyltransferase involved in cell wall biosynthesis
VPDVNATPEIGRLMDVARENGVWAQVHFVGQRGREALPLHYAACDVFVTTPWYEPFGITPVEAMACARPVIGSAVGGIKSTVIDNETGFLVPPNDPEALADKLTQLKRSPLLARHLGERGLARARRLFTWKRIARALVDCYQRAMVPARVDAPGARSLQTSRLAARR